MVLVRIQRADSNVRFSIKEKCNKEHVSAA